MTAFLKTYAGFGARETPGDVLFRMRYIAAKLRSYDFWLRSGGAPGADRAFQEEAGTKSFIYHEDAAAGHIAAFQMAARFHPAWDSLAVGSRRKHARNCYIMLSPTLSEPVDFGVCWSLDAKELGGTGMGIRIAKAFQIPLFNLAEPDAEERLFEFARSIRTPQYSTFG